VCVCLCVFVCLCVLVLVHGNAPREGSRVGQNRIYTPYTTLYSVISLQRTPYIHHIYMIPANPRR